MSQLPDRQTVTLGGFVVVGIALLVGALFAIGSLRGGLDSNIEVTAVFERVDGLKKGDAVWFSGVPVGTVGAVDLGGDGVEVTLSVDEDASDHIPTDTVAKVGSDGLIGNAIVVLEKQPEEPTGEGLQDGAVIETTGSLSMEDLMVQFQQTNEDLKAITTDVKSITATVADGEGTLGRLIEEDAVYDDVAATVARLERASGDVEHATASLASFSAKLDRDDALPSQLATDTETYERLTGTVDQLEDASEDASALIAELQASAENPDTPVGVLLQDEQAGADLGDTLEHASSSSERFDDTLAALRQSFLLKPLFKRAERAEREAAEEESVVIVHPDDGAAAASAD